MPEAAKRQQSEKLRGAAKKEAFHQSAESKVQIFTFDPSEPGADPARANINLASLNSCHARVQVLRKGATKRKLHYHPNIDQIYLVLKGKVRYYGPDDVVGGDLGPFQGIVYPENSRYWLENVDDGESWLLHFSAYPRGAKAARVVDVAPLRANKSGDR